VEKDHSPCQLSYSEGLEKTSPEGNPLEGENAPRPPVNLRGESFCSVRGRGWYHYKRSRKEMRKEKKTDRGSRVFLNFRSDGEESALGMHD